MLNKLSFNLMNSLNESETEAITINKKVYTETTYLNEGCTKVEEADTNKEDRLASLKTQLEKDGDQLSDDEKEAIEKEIADLEAEDLKESAPGTEAYDRLVSGDDIFFRDEGGQALLGHYADSYPEPEDYDEGYKPEFGGTEDGLAKAKAAAENRDVWEFIVVNDDCSVTGEVYTLCYGQDELMDFLKQLRQVNVVKRLEEAEEEPAPRKLTREEWNKEFGPGADPDVINAGREPENRVELVENENLTLDEVMWENFDECTDEIKEKVLNILNNLDTEAVKHEEWENGYSVEVKDKASGMSFWLDYNKDNDTFDWNQYIFNTTIEGDIIRQAIQSSYYKESGDMIAFDDFEGEAIIYLGDKGLLKVEEGQIEDARKDSIEKGLLTEEVEKSDDEIINELVNNFKEITGLEVSEIFNRDETKEGIFDDTKIDATSEAVLNYLTNLGLERSRIDELLYKLDDVLATKFDNEVVTESEVLTEDGKDIDKARNLKLMDMAARSVNDEELIEIWLTYGVPDEASDEDYVDIAADESEYIRIEREFSNLMKQAKVDGLYNCPADALEFAKKYEPELNNITEAAEPEAIEEAEVKGLKTVKSQGNIFMLEDETKKIIVGENYNEAEGLIENAEVYDNKEAADEDYLGRCEIIKDGEELGINNQMGEAEEE